MQEYTLVFAPQAQEDLESMVARLNERSPEKVPEWVACLKEEIDTLKPCWNDVHLLQKMASGGM